MRIGLQLVYWLLVVPAAAFNWVLGRDPLLLRGGRRRTTYWIPLAPDDSATDYLSPDDSANRPLGAASWLSACLRLFARRPGPAGLALDKARPAEIPDEIYTLW